MRKWIIVVYALALLCGLVALWHYGVSAASGAGVTPRLGLSIVASSILNAAGSLMLCRYITPRRTVLKVERDPIESAWTPSRRKPFRIRFSRRVREPA